MKLLLSLVVVGFCTACTVTTEPNIDDVPPEAPPPPARFHGHRTGYAGLLLLHDSESDGCVIAARGDGGFLEWPCGNLDDLSPDAVPPGVKVETGQDNDR